MNTTMIRLVHSLLIGGICQLGFSQAPADEFLTDESYDKIADIKGRKIASGLVIVNGKLILPPYTIENKGFKLVLNGDVVIFETFQASLIPPTPVPKKPELHCKVEDVTSIDKLKNEKGIRYDADLLHYYSRKYHKNAEKVSGKMVEFFETLSFVKNAEAVKGGYSIRIFTKDGQTIKFRGYERITVHTDESQRKVTESEGQSIVYNLLSGNFILIDEGSLAGIRRRKTISTQPEELFKVLVQGVKNSKTEKELQSYVEKEFPKLKGPYADGFWKDMLTNFKTEEIDLEKIQLAD